MSSERVNLTDHLTHATLSSGLYCHVLFVPVRSSGPLRQVFRFSVVGSERPYCSLIFSFVLFFCFCFADMENRRPARPVNHFPASSETSASVSSPLHERFDYLFKVVLVGDTGVGKSSLLNRFADNTFTERMTATIGVDFKIRTLQIEGKRVKLQIWDSAGQERFRALTASYYRGAHAVAIVFDLTCMESLNALQNVWIDEIDRHCPASACRVVIGNKNDLVKSREVSVGEVHQMMRSLGCLYLETSAKTADNVQNAFESVVRRIIERCVVVVAFFLFFYSFFMTCRSLSVGVSVSQPIAAFAVSALNHVVLTPYLVFSSSSYVSCICFKRSCMKRRFCTTFSGPTTALSRTSCVRHPG